jgi:AcrR family transcriptional regulator
VGCAPTAQRALGPSPEWTARRTELWEQLAGLFVREGFRNLTIGDLANRLSCSRRTLYSLAESRDDLIRGVIEHLFDGRIAAAAEAARGAPPGVAAVVAHLSNGVLALDASQVFLDELRARPTTAALLAAFRERERDSLRDVIDDGVSIDALVVPDVELVADVLDAAAERLASRRARLGTPTVEAAIDALGGLASSWLASG